MGGYIQDVSGAAPLPTFPTSSAGQVADAPAAPAAPADNGSWLPTIGGIAAVEAARYGAGKAWGALKGAAPVADAAAAAAPEAAAAPGLAARAMSMAKNIPGVGMLKSAVRPTGKAAAYAAAAAGAYGAVKGWADPDNQGRKDWVADTDAVGQAMHNASLLGTIGATANTVKDLGVNTLANAYNYGVAPTAQFLAHGTAPTTPDVTPAAAAAAAAPGVATPSAAAHPAADYFRMAHDDFVKHLGGLTNAEGQALLAHMSQMPKSTPQEQIMNQIAQVHNEQYTAAMREAAKIKDPNARASAVSKIQATYAGNMRTLIGGGQAIPFDKNVTGQ